MKTNARPVITVLFVFSLIIACGGSGGGGSNSSSGGGSGDGTTYGVAITSFDSPATANAGDDITIDLSVYNEGNTLASPGTLI